MRRVATLIVIALTFSQEAAADAAVMTVSPTANSITTDRSMPISVSFSEPMDPATLSDMSFAVFGLWSGVVPGTVSLSPDGLTAVFSPSRPLFAGERVTVSLSRSIKTIGGDPLVHGYEWHFMVATRAATLKPVETTRISVRRKGEEWIQTYGAYAGDFDEDGFTDLAVPNERSNDFRLFLNDGAGFYPEFDTYPIPSGSRPSVNEGADFDRDGHMDYVVGSSTGATVGLFMGDGNGGLHGQGSFTVGLGVRGLTVLDLNGDNYPDVVTASRQESVLSILLNDGTGSFLPATEFTTPATGETAAAAADMNEDGIMDVVIGTFNSSEIVVLFGDGTGGLDFYDRYRAGGPVWMVVTGDVNGDGHADVATANSQDGTVSVHLGDGTGRLGPATTYAAGDFTIAIDLGDLDGDGDLDLVASDFGNTVFPPGGGSWIVLENTGAGAFRKSIAYETNGAGSCVVLHDRNNDGALDITAIDELQDQLILFTNQPVATSTDPSDLPSAAIPVAVYPNPISGVASVEYSLDIPSQVRIELFDVAGRRVATLLDQVRGAGTHRHRIDEALESAPAGTYLVAVSAGSRRAVVDVKKMR